MSEGKIRTTPQGLFEMHDGLGCYKLQEIIQSSFTNIEGPTCGMCNV
jgi:hypothetical protein